MCTKRQRHCQECLRLQEQAVSEWTGAATLSACLASWGRFGGRVTLHRYGRTHFAELGRRSGLARRGVML